MGTIRVGVIGTGVMGENHARNPVHHVGNARLTALADVDAAHRDALAHELGVPHTFDEGAALIRSGEVDAVVVAAPDRFHADLVLECLEAGLPVLCEKPLAPTPAEVRAIVEAEARGPRPLVTVGFMRRFDPGYLALRSRIASGVDGAVLMTHSAHRSFEAYPGGLLRGHPDQFRHPRDRPAPLVDGFADHPGGVEAGTRVVAARDPHGSAVHPLDRGRGGAAHGRPAGPRPLRLRRALRGRVRAGQRRTAARSRPRRGGPAAGVHRGLRRLRLPPDWRQRLAAAYRSELQSWVTATQEDRIPEGAAGTRDALRDTLVADALVRSMAAGGQAQDVAVSSPS